MKSHLIIALPGKYFGWGGGIEFLRYIANGLRAKQQDYELVVYLLLPVENRIESFTDLLRVGKRTLTESIKGRRLCLARKKPAFQDSMFDFFENTKSGTIEIRYYGDTPAGFVRCLKKIGADVVLPVNGTLGRNFPFPWIGYIYDFQHRYLSENFTSEECYWRDINFATILKDAKCIIVNSRAVKSDIERLYPWSAAQKIIVLPFSPIGLDEWFGSTDQSVCEKYDLPERYFLISNQFWIHKDHMAAIKAVELLGADSEVGLVCTGATHDYRRPDYLGTIRGYIEEHGLSRKISILGHIPKRDQIEIMKGAIAVVQPTLFEGGPGGGSVYDAVSLGVPVIISDIPVNREVEAEHIFYFEPGNSQQLASLMLQVCNTDFGRPPRNVLEKAAKARADKLGERLLEAVNLTISDY